MGNDCFNKYSFYISKKVTLAKTASVLFAAVQK